MKKLIFTILITLFCIQSQANVQSVWTKINNNSLPVQSERTYQPNDFSVYALNESYIKNLLFAIPENAENARIITLPMPDGNMMDFRVWQTPVMVPGLADKFPGIKNFTAVSIEQPAITAKINYTYLGFDAYIANGDNTYIIDRYSRTNSGYYICFYKKDHPATQHGHYCNVTDDNDVPTDEQLLRISNQPPKLAHKTYGSDKKTFRLALTCTGEYAQAVDGANPVKANVVSKIAATITRVNSVLEKELNISLQLISNNDQLVYLDPATDPFTAAENASINMSTQKTNQDNTNAVIGIANYDIGHVFCSAPNGIADLEGLCDLQHKARAGTGSPNPVGDPFDIDFVAHEIGHQLGAEHTFNDNTTTGCNNRANDETAYEPGAGSTIMGYAGLCGISNIALNSDDYFHAISLDQMSTYISSTNSATCGSTTISPNMPPTVANIQTVYNIPYKTPFELEAPPANDNDHDVLTYCWEQYDLGDYGQNIINTEYGPILRSFKPTPSRWRVFPIMDSIRANTLEYPGEKLPQVARDLNFRLTVRDVLNGEGSYNWSDTTVTLKATDQAGPFVVTSPNVNADYWRNGNSYTVTWDVANTNTAPVNCSNVDIYLSYDDGVTWPEVLAANTPNDGSEVVAVPPGSYTASARVKIKGTGNVFFDISDNGFVINDWPDSIHDVDAAGHINIYPNPATDNLAIRLVDGGIYNVEMFNSVGQVVFTKHVDQSTTLNISGLAPGVYHMVFTDEINGSKAVKKLVIN